MPAQPRPLTSLRIGDRVIVRCEDGRLEMEYALFDPGEVVLQSVDRLTVREAGYLTTAGDARTRLAQLGVTVALADQAVHAIPSDVLVAFARGATAARLAGKLGPAEVFDGGVYSVESGRYEGVWIDLGALAAATGLKGAALAMQALFFATVLGEVDADVPVHLSTERLADAKRPAERTHARPNLTTALRLPEAFKQLRPSRARGDAKTPRAEGALKEFLLQGIRERATATPHGSVRQRMQAFEAALVSEGPITGRQPALSSPSLAVDDDDAPGEHLDTLARGPNPDPMVAYLRARAALARGEGQLRGIAELLSGLAGQDRSFHEITLLTARAWLAAGDEVQARHYARLVTEDPGASDGLRLAALDILEANTPATERRPTGAPPAPVRVAPVVDVGADLAGKSRPPFAHEEIHDVVVPPAAPVPRVGGTHAPRRATPPIDLHAHHTATPLGMPAPVPPASPTEPDVVEGEPVTERKPTPAPSAADEIVVEAEDPVSAEPAPFPGGASPQALVPTFAARSEIVESMPLPEGLHEGMLGVGLMPKNPLEARIAMTRVARELARDYRIWYGTTLRTDPMAIEQMQRHLRRRFTEGQAPDPKVALELQRHGALLSEIIARRLGGVWVDVGPSEVGYWAMLVPPSTRIWPIGRVFRFFSLGHREKDLVHYFLELDARVRKYRESM